MNNRSSAALLNTGSRIRQKPAKIHGASPVSDLPQFSRVRKAPYMQLWPALGRCRAKGERGQVAAIYPLTADASAARSAAPAAFLNRPRGRAPGGVRTKMHIHALLGRAACMLRRAPRGGAGQSGAALNLSSQARPATSPPLYHGRSVCPYALIKHLGSASAGPQEVSAGLNGQEQDQRRTHDHRPQADQQIFVLYNCKCNRRSPPGLCKLDNASWIGLMQPSAPAAARPQSAARR